MFTALLMIGGVDEEAFPCKRSAAARTVPHSCFIRKNLPVLRHIGFTPHGESLKTTTIFECRKHGFGKRVQNDEILISGGFI
jgi:hypothetical protein